MRRRILGGPQLEDRASVFPCSTKALPIDTRVPPRHEETIYTHKMEGPTEDTSWLLHLGQLEAGRHDFLFRVQQRQAPALNDPQSQASFFFLKTFVECVSTSSNFKCIAAKSSTVRKCRRIGQKNI